MPGTYISPAETGFYATGTRYYDPEIGRFINADGYVSTGQGILGNNMFAYCGNNPINRIDPAGQLWSSILNFVKTAVSAIGKAIASKAPAYASVSGVTFIDGPLLIADSLAAIGALAITADAICQGIDQALEIQSIAKEKEKTKEKVIASTSDKQYNYWTASIQNGIVTPILPLTYSEARVWVAGGNDLLCRNHSAAIAIVKFYPTARWDAAHGRGKEGYLNHYHLSSAHTNHIWYYGE